MIKENKYLTFEILDDEKIGIVTAKQSYIPITQFKESFIEVGKILTKNNINALIFDKSNLDTFHQPSMEWYYVDWKLLLAEDGLKRHYKILPNDVWFQKSVEAGKNEIYEKYPEFDYSKFSVTYINKVEEAIEIEKKLTA